MSVPSRDACYLKALILTFVRRSHWALEASLNLVVPMHQPPKALLNPVLNRKTAIAIGDNDIANPTTITTQDSVRMTPFIFPS